MTEMTNDSMGKHTGIGEVQIANEVVASIAGISASEVEGVDSMAGGLAGELAGKFGAKNSVSYTHLTLPTILLV